MIKHKLATTLLVVAAVVMSTLASFSVATKALAVPPDDPDTPQTFWPINGDCPNNPGIKPPCPGDNAILKWDDELLQAIRANPAARPDDHRAGPRGGPHGHVRRLGGL